LVAPGLHWIKEHFSGETGPAKHETQKRAMQVNKNSIGDSRINCVAIQLP